MVIDTDNTHIYSVFIYYVLSVLRFIFSIIFLFHIYFKKDERLESNWEWVQSSRNVRKTAEQEMRRRECRSSDVKV